MPNHVHMVYDSLPDINVGRNGIPSNEDGGSLSTESGTPSAESEAPSAECPAQVAQGGAVAIDDRTRPIEMKSILAPNEYQDAARRNTIPTYKMLQSLKGHTARKSNAILRRDGAFWQDESYDHVIQNGTELERTILYVLNNPVAAGLVSLWEQWRWTYVKPDLF